MKHPFFDISTPGFRSRQHAVPASRQSVAAGRREDREFVSLAEGMAEEARKIRRTINAANGTTMRGMMTEHGVRAATTSPMCTRSTIAARAQSAWRTIASLDGRKLILTTARRSFDGYWRVGLTHISRRVRHHRSQLEPKPGATDLGNSWS